MQNLNTKFFIAVITLLCIVIYFIKSSRHVHGSANPTTISAVGTVKPKAEVLKTMPLQESIKPTLPQWLEAESRRMNKVTENPAEIELKLQQASQSLTAQEINWLALLASDASKPHNNRRLALYLLTQNPKNSFALTTILARKGLVPAEEKNHHAHQENFEHSFSLDIILSLEPLLLKDEKLRARLGSIANSDISPVTSDHIRRSLNSARSGNLYWTTKAQSLMAGRE